MCQNPTKHNLRASFWAATPAPEYQPPYQTMAGHGSAFCNTCYWGGERCHHPTEHFLTRYSAFVEYGFVETPHGSDRVAYCDIPGCGRDLRAGDRYYYCGNCEEGRWCLCMVCYGLGLACPDKTHAMHKVLAMERRQ
ncbi:hypothetical protein PG993_011794 [Apiospora rasikravindrae]|uniref:Uncharacterized protein n=1 Tax=Apiospora rasikravindrae TaxID=990691 RepID=A0ABR1S0T1_9PEZI